jgi:CHAT domain-containing protein
MSTAISSLLEKDERDLRDYVSSTETDHLQTLFEEIWQAIRQVPLFGGQPRGSTSNEALLMSRLAKSLAECSRSEALLAEAHRMMAYVLNASEEYESAIAEYIHAILYLERLGLHQKAARTRLGLVAALFMTGRYEQALEEGKRAEDWFRKAGDDDGRARLSANLGNLYHRWDQHARAVEYHNDAIESFRKLNNPAALAPCFLNLADSLSMLDRLEEADSTFEQSQRICEEHGLKDLGAQAKYNRAYLSFLRGRYSEAIQSFGELREHFRDDGSLRHSTLCDLDETEIYLHLNLKSEALTLARRAAEGFKQLGMKYEEAKARAFLGIGLTHGRNGNDALRVFSDAQQIFEAENNLYWVAVVELYRAQVHFMLGRHWEARSLAISANKSFASFAMPSKQAMALVLLTRIAIEVGNLDEADVYATELLGLIKDRPIPLHVFPCYSIAAQLNEHRGDLSKAMEFYALAARELEVQRTNLHCDELRVTFFKGKQQVYEALVRLSLLSEKGQSPIEAYNWCERAKSRGLVDLLSQHAPPLNPHGDPSILRRVRRLHEELNSYHIRCLKGQDTASPSVPSSQEIEIKKNELAENLRKLSEQDPEYVSLQKVSTASVDDVQRVLPENSALVEYFIARDEVLAFVVTRDGINVRRHLCTLHRIQHLHERIRLQIEKFRLGSKYIEEHGLQLQQAMNQHLRDLYSELIQPLVGSLRAKHLIIVPHGILHYLPFHAFSDGERYLIDSYTVSYAPSASVLQYCIEREPVQDASPLIVGIADDKAPLIRDEVSRLRKIIPGARTYFGKRATTEVVRQAAVESDFLHIATHAVFRTDNPMFSSFKLADGSLTALDLYSMKCRTNLVTLSGCKSGVGAIQDADELLGLMRGFLYAGARSLLLSLWDVNDQSTCAFMSTFYEKWLGGVSKAEAMRAAVQAVRGTQAHPYFWAPFTLVGNP